MSNVYTVTMSNQTVVADETLVLIHAASAWSSRGSLLEILRCTVTQQANATSAMQGILLGQKVTAFGTYTSTTPSPEVLGGPASAITGATDGAAGKAGTDASAEGGGTFTQLINDSFNVLNGYLWVPTPEERILVGPDIAFALKLLGTPGTLTGWNATVTFRELN